MTDDPPPSPALLPAGLRDVLPPEAAAEAACIETLLRVFAANGYQRVSPPLLEFAATLLAGSGEAVAEQTFRLMDPDSQRMMGLRADMTPQIARIATTRLGAAPRPLRLSYADQCVRVRGAGLAAARQVAQAGIELIGADTPAADAEMVLVGAEALAAIGLERVSFDLNLPTLAPILLDAAGIEGAARTSLARALDRKDVAAVARLGGPIAATLADLLLAAGAAPRALAALEAADLPPAGRVLAGRLAEMIAAIRAVAPELMLTVDPLEFRGFRYHTGVSVTVFAAGRHEEMGRGGRYVCGEAEAATGLTLLPDALLRAAARPAEMARAYIPCGADPAGRAAATLRAEGFATIVGLAPESDPAAEARRLLCSHILRDGQAAPVSPEH